MKMAFDLLNKQTDLLYKQTAEILKTFKGLIHSGYEPDSCETHGVKWDDDELSGEVVSFDDKEV